MSATSVCLALLTLLWMGCGGSQEDEPRTADDVDEEEEPVAEGSPDRDRPPLSDERNEEEELAGGEEVVDPSTGDVALPSDEEMARPAAPPRPEPNGRARRRIDDGLQMAAAGNLEGAREAFESALGADDRAFQAAFNLGVVLERLGRDREAREAYRRALDIQPDYERAIEAMARMDVRGGHVERALSFVEQRARRYPANLGIQVNYADLLVQAGRYRDAIQVARGVLRHDERSVPAMLVFAKANYHLGRYELALWVLDQAAEIDENNAEIYNIRGFVHLAQDRRLLAIEDFERAVQLRPDYAEARNNLGVQYLISGRYEQAVEQLEAAQRLSPNWVSVYLNLGDAYRGAQNWTKSKNTLEKALRLDSELPEAYYNLGVLYLAAREIEGMDRVTQLQKSIEAFQRYKNMSASRLKAEDPVHRLLQDAQRALEREQTRIERERAAAEEAARREAAREAGDAGEEDIQWEDGGGEGGGGEEGGGEAGEGEGGDEDIQWEDEDIQWE